MARAAIAAENWLHARLFAAVAAAAAAAVAWAPAYWQQNQLWLLVGLVALLGIPHGALDHYTARLVWPLRGARWRWELRFFGLYSAVSLAVIAAWLWQPGVMLALFLAVSVLHFGEGDALLARLPGGEALVRGLLPVVIPTAQHPLEVAQLFALLSSPAAAAGLVAALQLLYWPLLALWAVALGKLLWRAATLPPQRLAAATAALELTTTLLLLALLPPLLAFALYFALLHSLRHLLDSARAWVPPGRRGGFLLRTALPVTLATLALGGVGYGLMAHFGAPALSADERLIQLLFIGLAALTFPHMALINWAKRRGVL